MSFELEPLFECKDIKVWNAWVAPQSDGYGQAIMHFANRFAAKMETLMDAGEFNLTQEQVSDCANEVDTEGLTMFMYGAAVKVLKDCWKYGDQLTELHNKKYGANGSEPVNPAVVTIGV